MWPTYLSGPASDERVLHEIEIKCILSFLCEATFWDHLWRPRILMMGIIHPINTFRIQILEFWKCNIIILSAPHNISYHIIISYPVTWWSSSIFTILAEIQYLTSSIFTLLAEIGCWPFKLNWLTVQMACLWTIGTGMTNACYSQLNFVPYIEKECWSCFTDPYLT